MVGIFFSNGNSSIETRDLGGMTELVRGNEHLLLDRLMPVVRAQSIGLDLQSVTRIDAAGLAALITLYSEACKAGHRLTVSHPSRHVQEILNLVGLDRILIPQPEGDQGVGSMQLQRTAA
jgi:anti-anti-sigma factor